MVKRTIMGRMRPLFWLVPIFLFVIVSYAIAGQTSASPLWEYKALKQAAGSIPGDGKIASSLKAVMNQIKEGVITRELDTSTLSNPLVRVNEYGSIQTYIYVDTLGAEAEALLEDYGAVIEITNEKLGIVQAWIPLHRIKEVAQLSFVNRIAPPGYGFPSVGSVTSEGVAILNADQVQSQKGWDGSGKKVGVISNGIDNLASAQASGDLPTTVTTPSYTGSGDEGTAMLEIVHDMAPGADLLFCGPQTSLEMVQCIADLDTAGADVIVDDFFFFGEGFLEDTAVAQAVKNFAASKVYATSCGNRSDSHYEGNFFGSITLAGLQGVPEHNFGNAAAGGSDPTMDVLVPAGGTVIVLLQWNDPFGGSGNDYDLLIIDDTETELLNGSFEVQDGTGDPWEGTFYSNNTGSTRRVKVVVAKWSGQNRFLEFFVIGGQVEEFNVPEGSIVGHAAVDGILSTGAINASDPGNDTAASYSAQGPSKIFIPAQETRRTPHVMGIDGVQVTGAGGFSSPFYGTSAAAPHVAAAAALLMSGSASFTAAGTVAALKATAVDLGTPGLDTIYGAGRVDALAAADWLEAIGQLVTDYYNDILGREPDAAGRDAWIAEIQRIASLGIDVKEGFIALAKSFFNSAEYLLQAKSDSAYVTDLYQTFFQRTPAQSEVDYWTGLLSEGLARNVVMNYFVFSGEFGLFLEGIFGTSSELPENNLVNDFYRGFPNRLPDSVGFNNWVALMRNAQCTGDEQVRNLSYQIAGGFIDSQEYILRNRSDSEYVEDLYNGILRRGALPDEFSYWVNFLAQGNTRQDTLPYFTGSAEFQFTVDQVIAAGDPDLCPDAACVDMSGTWSVMQVTDNTLCGGGSAEVDYVTPVVTQVGCNATFYDAATGFGPFTITLVGNSGTWTGSYPEEGGMTTANVNIYASGEILGGWVIWEWSGPGESCSGFTQISGNRISQ